MIKLTKGQAALEFMLTYGWALLVLGALIAGLAYFMPHPKSLLPDKCVFGAITPCLGVQLTDAELIMVLRNSAGQTLYDFNATTIMPKNVKCNVMGLSQADIPVDQRFNITCNNAILGFKDDTRVRILITYKKIRGGLDQTEIGEVYAK
jgi:hypothetical protein